LYQIAAAIPGDPRTGCLEEPMKLTEERRGRILLIAHLRQDSGKLRAPAGLHLA